MAKQPRWDPERFLTYVFGRAEEALGYRPLPAELSTAANVSDSVISRWKSGSSKPSPENLQSLAAVFGMDLVTLYRLVGLLPETDEPVAAQRTRPHPLASQVGRVLAAEVSPLSAAERAEFEVVLRRVLRGFGVTPAREESTGD